MKALELLKEIDNTTIFKEDFQNRINEAIKELEEFQHNYLRKVSRDSKEGYRIKYRINDRPLRPKPKLNPPAQF